MSPIRTRTFGHERAGVSASINSILQKVTDASGINRKQLAEQLAVAGAEPADAERNKRTLIADLRWLVSEGYLIEFNDGTLDLPRTKAPAPVAASAHAPVTAAADAGSGATVDEAAEPTPSQSTTPAEPEQVSPRPIDSEMESQSTVANGMSGEQSVEPHLAKQAPEQLATALPPEPPANPDAAAQDQSSANLDEGEVHFVFVEIG